MAGFEYRQAEEIRDAFQRHGVRYLFLCKSAAILLGFPDTTQDVDLFPLRTPENGRAISSALRELGFELTSQQITEIERGKDFVQLKTGPFDIDLIFAPDGIDDFSIAWSRHIEVEGFPVCHLDDISPANDPQIEHEIENQCLGWSRFETIGCSIVIRKPIGSNWTGFQFQGITPYSCAVCDFKEDGLPLPGGMFVRCCSRGANSRFPPIVSQARPSRCPRRR